MTTNLPAPPLSSDTRPYRVALLSIQPDGEDFLVGSQALGGFYQFPPQGVTVLDRLRAGLSPAAIKAELATDAQGDGVDVDDFIETLLDIGFIRSTDAPDPVPLEAAPDRRWLFAVDRRVAALFFSLPAMIGYAALLAAAVLVAARTPAARPDPAAFFLDHDLAPTLILLLILAFGTTALHELGHLLAAAREGIASRVGIGTRLWNIVVEADLTGIFALPKRRRYLPLAAGMLVDLLTIAATTLIIAWLIRAQASPFVIALLKAMVLQTIATIIWQFNLFLRTDGYYLLSNWASYPNLDADARIYIANRVHRLTRGLRGSAQAPATTHRLATLRVFAAIWVFGRVLAVAMLVFVVVPTLYRYCAKAWRTIGDPAASRATIIDTSVFAALCVAMLTMGMVLWLRPKLKHARLNRLPG